MVVRLAPRYRQSLAAIRDISVGVPGANGVVQVPLSEVARIDLVSGASFIYRGQQERYIPIQFSVRGRDLGSAVRDAQDRVAPGVALPGAYRREAVAECADLGEPRLRLGRRAPLRSCVLPGLS